MSWMKKLFGKEEIRILREENTLLKETLDAQRAELEAMTERFRIASGAQAALQKHSAALNADHPDLWARYFTKGGRAIRDAEKGMVTTC